MQLRGSPIPPKNVPEKWRKHVTTMPLVDSVAALVSLISDSKKEGDPPQDALNNLGVATIALGRYEEAAALFERTVELSSKGRPSASSSFSCERNRVPRW